MVVARDAHATREWLEGALYVWSMLRQHNKGQMPLRSLETAFRREGGWCEMAASLAAEERLPFKAATKQHSEH
jgi:hypothetical protein